MEESTTWFIRRIRLNSGGYDRSGGYWGTGLPLYECFSDYADMSCHFRASDRSGAAAQLIASTYWKHRSINPRLARKA